MAPLDGTPTLKYFDLRAFNGFAGRGGAVRFFFMMNNVPYEDQLVMLDAGWKAEKAIIVESGENPAGHLPVVFYNGEVLIEHQPIMRYFARKLGVYGKDAERDYRVDMVASASATWRDQLVAAVFGDDAGKEKYKSQERAGHYSCFNRLVDKYGKDGFAVGDEGSFADALLFAHMWDDQGGFGDVDMSLYPALAALYKRFKSIPAVQAWCQAERPAAK